MNESESIGEYVPIDSLIAWENNPRINDHAIEKVARSIERFGFASPVIARQEDMMVIAGHTRIAAARLLGLKTVPCRFMKLNRTEAELLALADNKIGEIAEGNNDKLLSIVKDLIEEDLEYTGFTNDEIDMLINENTMYEDNFDDSEFEDVENQYEDSKAGEIVQIILWYNEDENNIFRDYIKTISTKIDGSNSEIILELLKNEYNKIKKENSWW